MGHNFYQLIKNNLSSIFIIRLNTLKSIRLILKAYNEFAKKSDVDLCKKHLFIFFSFSLSIEAYSLPLLCFKRANNISFGITIHTWKWLIDWSYIWLLKEIHLDVFEEVRLLRVPTNVQHISMAETRSEFFKVKFLWTGNGSTLKKQPQAEC